MNLLIAQLGFPFHKTEVGDLLGITSVSKAGKGWLSKAHREGLQTNGEERACNRKTGKGYELSSHI